MLGQVGVVRDGDDEVGVGERHDQLEAYVHGQNLLPRARVLGAGQNDEEEVPRAEHGHADAVPQPVAADGYYQEREPADRRQSQRGALVHAGGVDDQDRGVQHDVDHPDQLEVRVGAEKVADHAAGLGRGAVGKEAEHDGFRGHENERARGHMRAV